MFRWQFNRLSVHIGGVHSIVWQEKKKKNTKAHNEEQRRPTEGSLSGSGTGTGEAEKDSNPKPGYQQSCVAEYNRIIKKDKKNGIKHTV